MSSVYPSPAICCRHLVLEGDVLICGAIWVHSERCDRRYMYVMNTSSGFVTAEYLLDALRIMAEHLHLRHLGWFSSPFIIILDSTASQFSLWIFIFVFACFSSVFFFLMLMKQCSNMTFAVASIQCMGFKSRLSSWHVHNVLRTLIFTAVGFSFVNWKWITAKWKYKYSVTAANYVVMLVILVATAMIWFQTDMLLYWGVMGQLGYFVLMLLADTA